MKTLRRLSSLILAFLIIILSPAIALANNIDSIDMTVDLQEDGSAIITDHRIFNANEGTEHYIPFANLGESEIKDFKVFEKGVQLQDVGTWDVNGSRAEKAGKYGINYTGDGLELCFGIGELGKRDFTVQYRVTNIVRKLHDNKQAIYWQFINPDMEPISKINISVTNKVGLKYKFPDTKMWGFGYDGTTEITEDALLLKAEDNFTTSDYVVLLSIFPEGTFQTSANYEYTEKDLVDKAMVGATANDGSSGEVNTDNAGSGPEITPPATPSRKSNEFKPVSSFFRILAFLGSIVARFVPVAIILFVVNLFTGKNRKYSKTYYKPQVDREFYYRDIPYDGNFIEVGKLILANTKNYVSSLILKWVQEGRLVDQTEMTGLIFKRETLNLIFNPDKFVPNETEVEDDLWKMAVYASGDDDVLSEKEFTRYMRRNINKFNEWTADCGKYSGDKLVEKGYLEKKERKVLFFPITDYVITEKGQELLNNIEGFKNYLRDFSMLNERGVGEVKLWDQYMIWASMLDISEEVYEQLKIIDPQVVDSMNYDATTIIMTNSFANNIMSTQSSINSSSSSGGGGSSFSGGGGGASGGSSGGGTR